MGRIEGEIERLIFGDELDCGGNSKSKAAKQLKRVL
jgi:hypothetical protein